LEPREAKSFAGTSAPFYRKTAWRSFTRSQRSSSRDASIRFAYFLAMSVEQPAIAA
jgi:hypothetical protein